MTKDKDFKRLIRARMAKTGESYAAARAQLQKAPKLPPDYEKLAGMSDDAVRAKTGGTWPEWVRALDDAGASSMPHRDIVQVLADSGVSDWWCQMVTVGYERMRGLRAVGQRRSGEFEAGKSRTFAVGLERLWDAFTDEAVRTRWLPTAEATPRNARAHSVVRFDLPDDTILEAYFVPKGDAKTQVALTHRKLPDADAAAASKEYWGGKLDLLGELLKG